MSVDVPVPFSMHRVVAVIVALAGFTGDVPSVAAESLSRAEYVAHKRQIHADFTADKLGCDRLTGQDQRVCVVKAQGRENVALAELDYNASGTAVDAARLAAARSESDRLAARALCAARLGGEKNRCPKEAETPGGKAAVDAHVPRQ